jgi:spore photoproduct lyase
MLSVCNTKWIRQIGDGSIIKRFDKTPPPIKATDVVCPHFFELKWATGCPFDCSWCYLKGTLRFLPQKTKPKVKDYQKIESHVKAFFTNLNHPKEILNTGEISDSLMCENSGNPFSKFIISLFETQTRHKVLFLTKSTNIKNLLEITPHKQAIISFSLNAEEVARKWEKGAPKISERIAAAKKVMEAGYETRVRIDPMMPISNWKMCYQMLIGQIFEKIVPERITLGSLRGLQSTINGSSDKSWLKYLSESSNWGKKVEFMARYQMYSFIIDYLLKEYHYTEVALCKETKAMWQKLGMDYKKIKCNCIW